MEVEEIQDPYVVLGVGRKASLQEIKHQYRERVKTCHPDLGSEPNRVERFKRLNQAYRLLSDPDLRARYDEGLEIPDDDPQMSPPAPANAEDREKADQNAEMLAAGRRHLEANRFSEAEAITRLALQRDHHSADAYVLIAQALAGQRRIAEALGCLNLALQLNPENEDARRALRELRGRQRQAA